MSEKHPSMDKPMGTINELIEVMARAAAAKQGEPDNWRAWTKDMSDAIEGAEEAGFIIAHKETATRLLREWVRQKFGLWITWRTAFMTVRVVLALSNEATK